MIESAAFFHAVKDIFELFPTSVSKFKLTNDGLGDGLGIGTELFVGVGVGVGIGVGVGVAVGVGVGVGVGIGVGVGLGVGVGFRTVTPLFQTNLFPDLMHV